MDRGRGSKQRGFGLIVYAVLALGILGTLAGIGYSIRKAGADSVRAELQPKLDACAVEVEKHNAAARAMAEESARKAKEAARALAAAKVKGKVWEDQAARLTAVLTAKRPPDKPAPTDCRSAWNEIRGQK